MCVSGSGMCGGGIEVVHNTLNLKLTRLYSSASALK